MPSDLARRGSKHSAVAPCCAPRNGRSMAERSTPRSTNSAIPDAAAHHRWCKARANFARPSKAHGRRAVMSVSTEAPPASKTIERSRKWQRAAARPHVAAISRRARPLSPLASGRSQGSATAVHDRQQARWRRQQLLHNGRPEISRAEDVLRQHPRDNVVGGGTREQRAPSSCRWLRSPSRPGSSRATSKQWRRRA